MTTVRRALPPPTAAGTVTGTASRLSRRSVHTTGISIWPTPALMASRTSRSAAINTSMTAKRVLHEQVVGGFGVFFDRPVVGLDRIAPPGQVPPAGVGEGEHVRHRAELGPAQRPQPQQIAALLQPGQPALAVAVPVPTGR